MLVNVSHTLYGRHRDRAVERWCRPEPSHPDISNTHQSPGIKHHLQRDKHYNITMSIREAESRSQMRTHEGADTQQTDCGRQKQVQHEI